MEQAEYDKMFAVEDSLWWFVGRRKFIASILGSPKRKKKIKIADVGSGTGGMTNWLARYGTVTGVEPNNNARALSRKRHITVVSGSATHLPLNSGTFDLVCILDVLYHKGVQSDTSALKEAYRVLKPGGMLLVTDCALPILSGAHDKAVYTRQRYYLGELAEKIESAG